MEFIAKLKNFALELKAKVTGLSGERDVDDEMYITFEQAVEILRRELKYPEDRALHFVKCFDRNQDGRLSVHEFTLFKNKIDETKHSVIPTFKQYDLDGNGYITVEEASSILQRPPFSFPPGRIKQLLEKFDRDGNGKLDIEEFADFYAETKATNDELTRRFEQLDRDGNGVLSEDEIVSVIRDMMGLDEQRARSMMRMFDHNRDGTLDKAEFIQLWSKMFGGTGGGVAAAAAGF